MAEKNGRLYICDRCGETTFCECTGEGETDGGYTRWNTFKPLPDDWGYSSDCKKIRRLCPRCNKIYRDMIKSFETEEYQG